MELTCLVCAAKFSARRSSRRFCSLSCSAKHGNRLKSQARIAAETKKCASCKQDLPLDNFAVKNAAKREFSSDCKACHRSVRNEIYRRDPGAEKARVRARTKLLQAKFREFKAQLACVRCGFDKHPAAIHFHHRNPGEKETSLSQAIRRGLSKSRIDAEIAKCDVLCANCHAIEHAVGMD